MKGRIMSMQVDVASEITKKYRNKLGVSLKLITGSDEIWVEIPLMPEEDWDDKLERSLRPKEKFDRHESETADRFVIEDLFSEYFENIFNRNSKWTVGLARRL